MISNSSISKKQQTIKSEILFDGVGLHSGRKVNLIIQPSETNSGIKFIRTDKDNQIFHGGTYEKNNKIYSNGGRVLNIVSLSETLIEARNKSLFNINKLNWIDGFFRKDIGWKAIRKL